MNFGRTIVLQMVDGLSGKIFYREPFTFQGRWKEFDDAADKFGSGSSDAMRDLISDYEIHQEYKDIEDDVLVRVLRNRGYYVSRD